MKKKGLLLLCLCIVLFFNGCTYCRYLDGDQYNTKKIDIYKISDDELVCTLSDVYDIADYMEIMYGEYGMGIDISGLPEDAEPLYRIDYWQNTTKQLLNPQVRLVRTSQDILYLDAGGNYYIYTEIDGAYLPAAAAEYSVSVTHIPEETAEGIMDITHYY